MSPGTWSRDGNWIYFQSKVTEVFQGDGLDPWAFLAVSPDEEWVLFTGRSLPVSELMPVENFR